MRSEPPGPGSGAAGTSLASSLRHLVRPLLTTRRPGKPRMGSGPSGSGSEGRRSARAVPAGVPRARALARSARRWESSRSAREPSAGVRRRLVPLAPAVRAALRGLTGLSLDDDLSQRTEAATRDNVPSGDYIEYMRRLIDLLLIALFL